MLANVSTSNLGGFVSSILAKLYISSVLRVVSVPSCPSCRCRRRPLSVCPPRRPSCSRRLSSVRRSRPPRSCRSSSVRPSRRPSDYSLHDVACEGWWMFPAPSCRCVAAKRCENHWFWNICGKIVAVAAVGNSPTSPGCSHIIFFLVDVYKENEFCFSFQNIIVLSKQFDFHYFCSASKGMLLVASAFSIIK